MDSRRVRTSTCLPMLCVSFHVFSILPSGVYEFFCFPNVPSGVWVFMFYITKWEIPCGFGFDLRCNPR
jgi:hypothetical protein